MIMNMIGDELVTSISEFKKNPKAELSKAAGRPFAVLTNNKPSFFVISPELYEELAEILWERRIESTLERRLTESSHPGKLVEIDLAGDGLKIYRSRK
jgi:antitoxin StbD